MLFHLDEEFFVVAVHADFSQVVQGGNLELRVQVLTGNPEGCQSQQLVVLFLDDSCGAVSVNQIHRQGESRFQQVENGDDFHQKVEKKRSHAQLDLRLLFDKH